MKKPGKYLKFYYECMETGVLPNEGLCRCLGKHNTKIFIPTHEEYGTDEYDGDPERFLWGYDGCRDTVYTNISAFNIAYEFTPLRQTIVLFLAAMNGEL